MKKIIQTLLALSFTLTSTVTSAFEFQDMVTMTEVEEGITAEEVDESIKQLSISEGILHVAMFPLSKQVTAVTGNPYRHLSIHNICDAKTAAVLADVSDAFVIVMPCRIAVVEGQDGKIRLWGMNPEMITTMNMPPEAKALAEAVAEQISNILAGAAEGAF